MSDRDSVVERRAPPDRFSGIEALSTGGHGLKIFRLKTGRYINLAHKLSQATPVMYCRSWVTSR